jgi:hypothetical protein
VPSYSQLEAEQWWGREVVTPELDWLGDEVCSRLGRPRSAFGTKGNNEHTSGGHRSQEWILRSLYCTNRTYTVQSGLTTDQARHIAAADFTPGAWGTAANRALMAAQTRALRDAAARGELPGVTQIMGTLDGRTTWGINLPSGNTLRPDSSHLDHWHLTFSRKAMRDMALMRKILAVIGDDMDQKEALAYPTPNAPGRTVGQAITDQSELRDWWIGAGRAAPGAPGYPREGSPAWIVENLPQLLAEHAAAPVDPAVLAAAVKVALLDPEVLAGIARAVADEDHRRSAG